MAETVFCPGLKHSAREIFKPYVFELLQIINAHAKIIIISHEVYSNFWMDKMDPLRGIVVKRITREAPHGILMKGYNVTVEHNWILHESCSAEREKRERERDKPSIDITHFFYYPRSVSFLLWNFWFRFFICHSYNHPWNKRRNNPEQEGKIKGKQVWCVCKTSQSHTAIHRGTYFFWTSLKIHYGSQCLCHEGAQEVKNESNFSLKQPLDTLSCSTFCAYPPSKLFFLLPPLKPTPPRKHNTPTLKHMCACLCARGPLPSVSPWLDCGSSSVPCDRVEVGFCFISFSISPQVLFPGIPKPAHPLWR